MNNTFLMDESVPRVAENAFPSAEIKNSLDQDLMVTVVSEAYRARLVCPSCSTYRPWHLNDSGNKASSQPRNKAFGPKFVAE
jgi:hypothetical protein